MANVLKSALIESILSLLALQYSQRRIAGRGLGPRDGPEVPAGRLSGAKPAIAPAGSGGSKATSFPWANTSQSADRHRRPQASISLRAKQAFRRL